MDSEENPDTVKLAELDHVQLLESQITEHKYNVYKNNLT